MLPGPGRLRMWVGPTASRQWGQDTAWSSGVPHASWTSTVGGPSAAYKPSHQPMRATRAGERSPPLAVNRYSLRTGRSWYGTR